ncbi:MAG: YitT family protein [Dysgonamonadaceae bacterium]|jgi:uncharacterized membrane-anchored protein YitT (DUF2179 family)|nr:YitT family protein [Dysgonamonadaceae bacterium]
MKANTGKHFKAYKQTVIQEIQDQFFILVGLCMYAFAWTGFLLPAQLTSGGVTGVAALVFFATKIPVAVPYFCIQAVLLLFSIKIFGFKFSLRTIINVFILTLLLSFFQSIIKKPLVANQTFMDCILGGIICGSGLGLVFNFKGSTGGTDIIAMIINKHWQISLGKALLICDVIIVSSSFLIFHSVEKIVFGFVVMGVSSYTVDMVLNGARQSVQFFIFSDKYDEIAEAIIQQARRGCTLLDGTGWYSQKPVKVIVVMAKKNESVTIFRIVKTIDPNAFISQSSVIGVYGRGFDPIKA